MKLEITDDGLRAAVREAIFAAMSQEQRDKLVTGAIAEVLSEKGHGYDSKTQLQRAFENAVNGLVFELVKERFATDMELRKKVAGMVEEAITKFAENEQIAGLIAEGLSYALKQRYR